MRRSTFGLRPRSLAPLLALGLAAGCGDDGGSGGPDSGSSDPECLEANNHDDLEWLQENVFSPSCSAFVSCHQGSALSAGGLNLEDGMTEENVVDVPSDIETSGGIDIVEPRDPENSFMLVILGQFGTDDPRIDPDIRTMPSNSPLLCGEKRNAIQRWIESL